jgi:hypothetical protein
MEVVSAPVAIVILLFLAQASALYAQVPPPAQALQRKETAASLPPVPKWIDTATVDLEFKDADMVMLLDKIHEETGLTILREGIPVNMTFSFSFHGPLKTALDQIADRFDYVWLPSQKRSKSLLFMKRFRSQEDHPEWREKEMVHIAEQVCRALQSPLAISESFGNTRDLLHLLYHKLDSRQIETLYHGGKLSFDDLNASQALLLNQQIYSVALGDTNVAWQRLQYRLEHLKDAKLVFKVSGAYKLLVLVLPPTVGGTPDSVIMRYYTEADLASGAVEAAISPANTEHPMPMVVQPDRAQNDDQPALQTKVDVRMQGGHLVDLLAAVAARSHCKTTLPDYLREQSLSCWARGISVRALMDLLAEQNDWAWNYTEARGIDILRRDTFVPANLSEVSTSFQIALPPGYRHFLGIGVPADDWLKNTDDKLTQAYRGIPGGDADAMRNALIRKSVRNGRDDAMMLRIWPTQPQKFGNKEELLYKDWTPQTKDSVLWSLFAVGLQGLFENRGLDIVSGRLTPYETNPALLRLSLDGRDAQGSYVNGVFGYSCTTVDAAGTTNTTGFFWTLKNASAPLPAPLEEVFRRY